MMRGMTEQFVIERTEEGDKEKKKKRRQNRRSNKHNNISVSADISDSPINGVHGVTSTYFGDGTAVNHATAFMNSSSSLPKIGLKIHLSTGQSSARASDVTFSFLPTLSISDQVLEFNNRHDQSQFSPALNGRVSRSCPGPIIYEDINEARSKEFVPPHKNVIPSGKQKNYYVPHWLPEAVTEGTKRGEIFITYFRMMLTTQLRRTVQSMGVPIDVLVNGVQAQNRAVEGDIVAIKLDPLSYWPRLRGSAGLNNSSGTSDDCSLPNEVVQVVGENCKRKEKLDREYEGSYNKNVLLSVEPGFHKEDNNFTDVVHPRLGIVHGNYKH